MSRCQIRRGCVLVASAVACVLIALPRTAAAATFSLQFDAPAPGTIADANGLGTGLPARFPGTGGDVLAGDPSLTLDSAAGVLRMTATRTDINGSYRVGNGGYIGIRLADLGFTGSEDFVVEAVFRNVQYSQPFDQFGLLVGSDLSHCIRGGYMYYNSPPQTALFSVNTLVIPQIQPPPIDWDLRVSSQLAPLAGQDIRLRLSRIGGAFRLDVENLTTPARSGQLAALVQPTHLAGQSDVYVCLFGATGMATQPAKMATVDSFQVTVVPEPPMRTIVGGALAGVALASRRRGRRDGHAVRSDA